jgi:pimeloyl-ACP methyl ester carboxylesterase
MKLKLFKWMPRSKMPNISLLFLHGLGGTGKIWRPIAAQLEDDFTCLAPDQRGHGESQLIPSDELHQFHATDYAKDVETLLGSGEFEPSDAVILIGHSMGVRTALALGALEVQKNEKKIRGLIAVDIGITNEWGGGIGLPLAAFIEKLPRTFPNKLTLREYLFAHCPDPSIAQYLSAVAKNDLKNEGGEEQWTFPFDHLSLVETIHQANEAKIGEWLREILAAGIPVLFLRGANSKIWLKADYETQKENFKHPLLTFEEWENCGHGLPFEQRTRFIERIKTFALEIMK